MITDEQWAEVRRKLHEEDPDRYISDEAHARLIAGTQGPACGSCGQPHVGMTCQERKDLLPRRHPGEGRRREELDRPAWEEAGLDPVEKVAL